ncbi:MAG: tyrosine-protein phosphatase [Gammaproteobacteria bacterium]|nr:tyrosine-protein phosphatase [Gammaproteobacteria bacterium]
MDRDIKRIHTFNTRTLNSIETKDGKRVRKNLFIRSSELSKLTAKDRRILKDEYNLSLVIDLRDNRESSKRVDKLNNEIDYLYMPVYREPLDGISRGEKFKLKELKDKIPSLVDLYRYLILSDDCTESLSKTIKLIMNNRGGSILWHCSTGKDRVGLITLIILYMLNVDLDIIRDDYLYSNKNLNGRSRLYAMGVFLATFSRIAYRKMRLIFSVQKEYFESAINAMIEKFGSIEGYILNGLKIKEEEIEEFKKYALE